MGTEPLLHLAHEESDRKACTETRAAFGSLTSRLATD